MRGLGKRLQKTLRLLPLGVIRIREAKTDRSRQCFASFPAGNYWDLGLRGDLGPTNHGSGFTFTPQASVLTSIAGYPGGGLASVPDPVKFATAA